MRGSKAIKIFALCLALSSLGVMADAQENRSVLSSDSLSLTQLTKKKKDKKKTFFQHIMTPFKWIGKNWSAYDPRYSTPSFYNWVGQLQNTSSLEMLHLKSGDMMDVNVRSKWSHKIGPHFGYSFLFYGYTIDLNALKGTHRRQEFTLSVNSNLVNIDLVRRRTGGDFLLNKLAMGVNGQFYDIIQDQSSKLSLDDLGENIFYDLTGFNINYFVNHKKYSNPAAFSNGAIQLRSVGTPILGFGYMHHKVRNSFPDEFTELGLVSLTDGKDNLLLDYDIVDEIWSDPTKRADFLKEVVTNNMTEMAQPYNLLANNFIFNQIPSVLRVEDWHLQLGYAFNLVFSRRLLLGMSLIASPGLKVLKVDNSSSVGAQAARVPAATAFLKNLGITIYDTQKKTNFGVNCYARASLTYNFNRWRAGFNANLNTSFYKSKDLNLTDGYGSLTAYVGYCFGRKKEYRWNGKNRDAYIKAALTKSQIEEMRDTTPESNINIGHTYLGKYKSTKYHTDDFDFDILGCDLVQGPDGSYGSFKVKTGRITYGNDTENRNKEGKVYQMDKNGTIHIESGHERGIYPVSWLKTQLDSRQMPINLYPEMLHYSLCGTLTMYLRDPSFGTHKPVKVTIDDFILSHSRDAKEWYFVGAKDFFSHSSYSIIGTANINNRLCRVYIESKKRGTKNYMYINTIKLSCLSWMKYVPDDRPISQISIPGTHDAGSSSLPESSITSMAHTQNFTISEQLTDGIRAFDIRLKKNMKYGHSMTCRDGFDESMVDIAAFLKAYPSEFIIAMIGSDEGGKWDEEMQANYNALLAKYPGLFVEDFGPTTKVKDVRGKILVIKRQKACPFGKLLKFKDNDTFTYDCFNVEDVYKEHKTYKKIKLVEEHLREAYENEDPTKWYITFNSIAWDPRHHKPYYSAWGAVNVRKPMNPSLRELLERKQYSEFGMVFLDFYNDHGDKPQLVQTIIKSNYHLKSDEDYIPVDMYNKALRIEQELSR